MRWRKGNLGPLSMSTLFANRGRDPGWFILDGFSVLPSLGTLSDSHDETKGSRKQSLYYAPLIEVEISKQRVQSGTVVEMMGFE